jgi:hypothetical protein
MSPQRDTATDSTPHGSHAPIEDGVPQCACFSTGWDEGFSAGWDGGRDYGIVKGAFAAGKLANDEDQDDEDTEAD